MCTVYPKKYAHGFVVLCFVVVMQSFIMNSHEVFIHIHQGCFAGTGAIVRLPQCQWSKPDGYGKISQCITTTKHSKAKTVCTFLGIYCIAFRHVGICRLKNIQQFMTQSHPDQIMKRHVSACKPKHMSNELNSFAPTYYRQPLTADWRSVLILAYDTSNIINQNFKNVSKKIWLDFC